MPAAGSRHGIGVQGRLPVMKDVNLEAGHRKIESLIFPTAQVMEMTRLLQIGSRQHQALSFPKPFSLRYG